MKITSIEINNYKSVEHLVVECCGDINVFIGENSVGKSNVFSAIEWLLGPAYPSMNRLNKSDYYRGDMGRDISIALAFDDGHCLRMDSCWHPYGNMANQKQGLNLDGTDYISDDIREKYTSAFIGTDRRVPDNPATSQWSLLGRLLKEINSRFLKENTTLENGTVVPKSKLFEERIKEIRDEILFSVTDDEGTNLMSALSEIMQEEISRQLCCGNSAFSVDLNIYDPWNFFRTLQIIVEEESSGLVFRASELGMGVQASITIAILKAYSRLKLHNRTPIFIDEPELFLHPQARRNFFRILQELANSGTQIFLTTHSSEFLSLARFDQIKVVRKNRKMGTYVRDAQPAKFIDDLYIRRSIVSCKEDLMLEYQNAYENTGDSLRASEGMFARKVILVEGESESLILPYMFDQIGYDYIAKGISIVRCGGKNELDRFYRLYSEFGIPCFVIFDGDKQNKGKGSEAESAKKNRALLELLGIEPVDFPTNCVHHNCLVFEKRLEENLGLSDVSENVKGLRLFKRFKQAVANGVELPEWISHMTNKLDNMPNEAQSVLLQREIPEADDIPL